jgi:hypothetical protein
MNVAYKIQPREEEIKKEVGALISTANALTVTNTEEKEGAVLFVRGINDSIKGVKAFFKPMKESTDAAHKAVVAREKETLAIPEQAKQITLSKITAHDRDQERIRQAELAKAQEVARKKHEAALKKAQARVDKIMAKSGDTQETIDLINMELNNDLNDTERQKLETQLSIEIARLENNQEAVEAIQQAAEEPVYMPPVIPKAEKVRGSVQKTKVEMSITNPMAVIKQVADGLLPPSCVKINEAEIKRVIKQNEGSQRKYPGIAFSFVRDTFVR